jgi:hypothetical protein
MGQEPLVPLDWEAEWHSRLFWDVLEIEKYFTDA